MKGEREKRSKGEINRKYNEHQILFSAAQAIVIVVLKEACNELREYGISNLLMCHKEQDYRNAQVVKMEMKDSSNVVTPQCIKYCMFTIFTYENVTQSGYKL